MLWIGNAVGMATVMTRFLIINFLNIIIFVLKEDVPYGSSKKVERCSFILVDARSIAELIREQGLGCTNERGIHGTGPVCVLAEGSLCSTNPGPVPIY